MVEPDQTCPACGLPKRECACPARGISLRLLPRDDAAGDVEPPGATRLIRELKGPTVLDTGGSPARVETLPAGGPPAASATVHAGPGYRARKRDRLVTWVVLLVALAAAAALLPWPVPGG